jgi:hypothetical protein
MKLISKSEINLNEVAKEFDQIIQGEVLDSIFTGTYPQNIWATIEDMEERLRSYSGKTNKQKELTMVFGHLMQMLRCVPLLHEGYDSMPLRVKRRAAFYYLGYLHCLWDFTHIITDSSHPGHRLLRDLLQSFKQSDVRSAAHRKAAAVLQRVQEDAENLYKNGDRRLHNKMARDFHDSEAYEGVSLRQIGKAVKAVAWGYKKVRGAKGHTAKK